MMSEALDLLQRLQTIIQNQENEIKTLRAEVIALKAKLSEEDSSVSRPPLLHLQTSNTG